MAQVGELKVDRCLIQLGQNFVRPTHWLTPSQNPSPDPVGPDQTVKVGPGQVDEATGRLTSSITIDTIQV